MHPGDPDGESLTTISGHESWIWWVVYFLGVGRVVDDFSNLVGA